MTATTLEVNIPWANGAMTFALPASAENDAQKDLIACVGAHYGFTRQEYVDWVWENFSSQCSAITAQGMRCRNIVTGCRQIDIWRWKERRGAYCRVHEDGT